MYEREPSFDEIDAWYAEREAQDETLFAIAEDEAALDALRELTTLVHVPEDEPAVPFILSEEYAALPKGKDVKPHPAPHQWDTQRTLDWLHDVD